MRVSKGTCTQSNRRERGSDEAEGDDSRKEHTSNSLESVAHVLGHLDKLMYLLNEMFVEFRVRVVR